MTAEASTPTEPSDSRRAVRLNVTVKPATYARLQEARNKKGIEINVSEVADKAINIELDRREKPGVADLVARLRVESDRRRGQPYRLGYQEGQRWAREAASWAEICHYAGLVESDISIESNWEELEGVQHWFEGRFKAPDDYNGTPSYDDAGGEYVQDVSRCDQYWRGWLAGVLEIFKLVRLELAPLGPPPDEERSAEQHAVRDVDPDDIPF
jgi:hypothetical protein